MHSLLKMQIAEIDHVHREEKAPSEGENALRHSEDHHDIEVESVSGDHSECGEVKHAKETDDEEKDGEGIDGEVKGDEETVVEERGDVEKDDRTARHDGGRVNDDHENDSDSKLDHHNLFCRAHTCPENTDARNALDFDSLAFPKQV